MNPTCCPLLMITLVVGSATGSVTKLGDVGRSLSNQDVVDVERIASTNGGKPWLFIGQPSQVGGLEIVQVYCSPTNSALEIRRGPMVYVSRRREPPTGIWKPWTLQGKGDYAQIAIAGRDFAQLEGDQDINRPFSVVGGISDKDLTGAVKFLRSGPSWIGASKKPIAVEGKWPILSVRRVQDGLFIFSLRKDDWSGQEVRVKKVGGKWIIIAIGSWIV